MDPSKQAYHGGFNQPAYNQPVISDGGFAVQQPSYPPQTGYSVQQAPYPNQPSAPYPSQAAGYPSQAAGYPSQPAGYPPSGYAQAPANTQYVTSPPTYNQATYSNDNPNMTGPGIQVTDPIDNFGSSFGEKTIRMRFIQRVYFILTCQLLVTVGFICLFLFHKGVKKFVQANLGLYIAAYVVFLVTYIALVCCSKLRMKFPTNFILLSIFTLALSYMVGMISSFHKTEIVLFSMGICCACCLCVSIFAIQTKFDFTKLGGVLFVIFLVVFFFGILAIIMRHKIMTMVYSGLIALVFMGFLAFDTQMVIGGKNRKYELSPEEYINGALQLYMDIIQIFLAILSLTSNSSS